MTTVRIAVDGSIEGWRRAARQALSLGLAPNECVWSSPDAPQSDLFAVPLADAAPSAAGAPPAVVAVPRAFLDRARRVACHRDPQRWALLYRMLWRIAQGERALLDDVTDPDVRTLTRWDAAVRRDGHKMKAFVRFKRIATPDDEGGGEAFVAWHRTDHLIVPLVAPFFADRFAPMRWSIFTPDASVHWDTERLRFGPGAGRDAVPDDDALEDLWRDYYRAIFNPARIKWRAMLSEMPAKHWSTLPESRVIHELLREAPERVRTMVANNRETAAAFVPHGAGLAGLHDALPSCTACEGCAYGGAAVPGMGREGATLAVVSAYPITPVGETSGIVSEHAALFAEALSAAGIAPDMVFVTAASKAPPYADASMTRPAGREVAIAGRFETCRPWLTAELDALNPRVVVCLGALAGRSVFGRAVSVARDRAVAFQPAAQRAGRLTYALSDVLRDNGARREDRWHALVEDLRSAAQLAGYGVAAPEPSDASART